MQGEERKDDKEAGHEALVPSYSDDFASSTARIQASLGLPEAIVCDLLQEKDKVSIVVVADDSRSMASVIAAAPTPTTYWQELIDALYQLVSILLVIEHTDGFWLQFLNDKQTHHVTKQEDLDMIFHLKPTAGGVHTPLRTSLRTVLKRKNDEELLCLVMTDGHPTDCTFTEFARFLRRKPRNAYISFVMCSDDLTVVDKYNRYMGPIPGCDVTADYVFERNKALQVGKELTCEEWLTKILFLKCTLFQRIDERPVFGNDADTSMRQNSPCRKNRGRRQRAYCCIVS